MKLRKPANYRYTQLDAVWPEPGIVALGGPKGESVTLDRIAGVPDRYLERQGIQGQPRRVRIGRRAGFEIVSGSKAALVVPISGESWVIVVESPAAGALLRSVTKWLEGRFTITFALGFGVPVRELSERGDSWRVVDHAGGDKRMRVSYAYGVAKQVEPLP